ncbi:PREDICTED: tubulin-specific chaperone D [Nicrophorus vespilloides]|uniref:Tubulin-specific chaperone D n=1 Tax=Nicrophorus vespilloides TaxID=110193 RepID=A0ABM1MAD8_NICVS|nr:PREDICTED: tubulin-specific chaperone D [Nicrophorus vespilloides]
MGEAIDEIQKDEDTFGLGCAMEYFSEHNEIAEMIMNLKNVLRSGQSIIERAYERYMDVLKQYIEQPHLLDTHLETILQKIIVIIRDPDVDMQVKHETFKYMYFLINVRGYKVIVRHLPHEVADFEPVLKLLEAQDPNDSKNWTTRYVLLLWLSIIVMIPFHMSRLDGFEEGKGGDQKTVMFRVMEICKTYTVVGDKCRDAAAYLISKYLTRTDVKEQYLSSFLNWACELSVEKDSSSFIKYGTLSSVAMIIKHGKRDDILPHAQKLLQWIINAEIKSYPGCNIQKLVYKIVQRIGLTFLPPRIAKWRYMRGNRSLTSNLCSGDSGSSVISSAPMDDVNAMIEEEDIEVPEEIEEIIDQLIQGLRSADGVVRWSAAKGIGRVTGRLPKELADEVVGSVLELFSPREGDGAWHGGCLALAELGRRGLLLPQRLPEVVPVVLKALIYDEPRGYASVGSHIRDSACYVCWAFARAYEIDDLKPFVNDIASQLLVVTCFDREINCRRAASAAFQENVGRQGTFPHGIDILTTADFFAVSVRNSSFLTISVFIGQFPEYTKHLIDHLVERKVVHWDIAIRELSAKALHNLAPLAVDYMVGTVLPMLFEKSRSIDLNSRHGSILAIGDIIHAISQVSEDALNESILMEVKDLVPKYRERHFFRGMGGELMKQACSDFIKKCSLAHLPFHNSDIVDDWLLLLNECLSYDVPNIRLGAIDALPALFTEFYKDASKAQMQKDIIDKYMKEMKNDNVQVVRMGHSLALGSLPAFMLFPHIHEILQSLLDAAVINAATVKWAESRRDAIKALTSICVTLNEELDSAVGEDYLKKIYEALLAGLTEYTVDNRGDIGAWVREVSMLGLQHITLLLTVNTNFLNTDLMTRIICGVSQQSVEKIDRTRALAGKVFYSLIHSDPIVPNIPHHEALKSLFPKDECDLLNWNSASTTFPRFVNLLEFPEYTYSIMLGLICSVGGMAETLVKCSSHSLFDHMKEKPIEKIERLCETTHEIFANCQKNDRIVIPMFRFLDRLFSSGCIDHILDNLQSDFAKKILKLVQMELNGCKDIYKLIDGISILCQFIQVKSDVCSTALVQLSILLCHRQPYVRRSTSTKLFESILVYGDNSIIPEENLDEISQLLSTTNWEEPVEVVRPLRNKLCALMGTRVPVAKKK